MARELFHILISSDSLSMPRPWLKKRPTERPDQFFTFTGTYPFLLERMVQRQMPDNYVRVTNFSRRAGSISNINACGIDLVSWMSPSVVVIHHGIVDCWVRKPETMERNKTEAEFAAQLTSFFALRDKEAPGLPVIIVKILQVVGSNSHVHPEQNKLINTYNALIEATAADESNVQVVSIPSGANVHADGHHLSRLGHRAMAEMLSKAILKHPNRRPPISAIRESAIREEAASA